MSNDTSTHTAQAGQPATKAIGEESLAPQQTRIMGRVSYLLAWFGGCVSIGTFRPRWPSP